MAPVVARGLLIKKKTLPVRGMSLQYRILQMSTLGVNKT